MSKAVLETPRLVLRPMQTDDLDALLEIFGDPRVMAAFNEPPLDRERTERWLQRNLDHQQEHGYGLFAVIHKVDHRLIGDCGLERMRLQGETVTELGYDLRSDYWRQGYATEAASAVRDFAFRELQLPGLVSLIRVGNLASRHVAEKIGMHLVAEIERYDLQYWHYAIQRPVGIEVRSTAG